MSDFEFDAPLPYDSTIADEGVGFTVVLSGREYGTFHCIYLDPLSKRTEALNKQFEARHAKAIRTGKLKGIAQGKLLFIENILKGWSDVKNLKGKDVPFSIEAATAYFSGPAGDHVYAELWKHFTASEHFVAEEFYAIDAEAAEKN
ncbi:hypothetical protein WSK_2078 [Novosphingobium sp. Rr 2-17]|uniref:hypothetical protein n=1 Tax=Novosphingobium sp. Rr 2-17 TaxID=555793 RepID=UPI0002698898|nr:hypothetical protein [Novosphingobium sp. Rr 2-17]EIZ79233.1 hypothetical protein WSK_2078 [Novosphingobium sp. Rr 2-17]